MGTWKRKWSGQSLGNERAGVGEWKKCEIAIPSVRIAVVPQLFRTRPPYSNLEWRLIWIAMDSWLAGFSEQERRLRRAGAAFRTVLRALPWLQRRNIRFPICSSQYARAVRNLMFIRVMTLSHATSLSAALCSSFVSWMDFVGLYFEHSSSNQQTFQLLIVDGVSSTSPARNRFVEESATCGAVSGLHLQDL